MSKLKIKFSVFEKRLAMQVIEQSSDITGNVNKPLDFKASNGIAITSEMRPGIYPELDQIAIRGGDSACDLDVVYGRFQSTQDAVIFSERAKDAVKELLQSLDKRVIEEFSNSEGKLIQLPNCEVMFNTMNGTIIFQLVKCKFKELPKSLHSSSYFQIQFDPKDPNSLKVFCPLELNETSTQMIQTGNLNEGQIKELKFKLIKMLSGIGADASMEDCSNGEYPCYLLQSL